MSTNPAPSLNQVMLGIDQFAVMKSDAILKEAIDVIGEKGIGIVCLQDEGGNLIGVFSDGDLRRLLLKQQKPLPALLMDDLILHSNKDFVSLNVSESLVHALKVMEEKKIWDLPLTDERGKLVGLLHLHNVILFLMSDYAK